MSSVRAPFFGWRIVGLGVALYALGPGLLEAYGFMATPLATELGISNQSFGVGMSIFVLAFASTAPAIGWLLDRGPFRATLLVSVALMAFGLLGISQSESANAIGGWIALAALGIGTYGQIGPPVMVANWFRLRRGRALGLATLGYSVAGMSMPFLTAFLLDALGWRSTVRTLALAASAALVPAILLFAVRRPADIGQSADGEPELAPASAEPELGAGEIGGVLRTTTFWLLGMGLAVAASASLGGVFLVRHFENLHIPLAEVRWVLGTMSLGALLGRVGVGWLLDRWDPRWLASFVIATQALGWIGVSYAQSFQQFLLLAVPAGMAAGGFGVSGPMLQAACFGPRVIGRVTGLHGLIGLPVLLAGTPLAGRAADHVGSFPPVFRGLAVVVVAAAALVACVRVPRSPVIPAPAR
jgi:MFS family permease